MLLTVHLCLPPRKHRPGQYIASCTMEFIGNDKVFSLSVQTANLTHRYIYVASVFARRKDRFEFALHYS